jgi:hypothetical protein
VFDRLAAGEIELGSSVPGQVKNLEFTLECESTGQGSLTVFIDLRWQRTHCRTAVPGRDWAMRAAHSAGQIWWTLVFVTRRREGRLVKRAPRHVEL